MAGETRPARRPQRWFEFRRPIPATWAWILGAACWVIFFGLWELADATGFATPLLLPTPDTVIAKLIELLGGKDFPVDILHSILRVLGSFFAASAIAVPLGVLMGSFRTVEAFFNPFVSAWRYLPATALIPVLLMWFGVEERPKFALLFIGVVFFLITLVMDHTQQVRGELIDTALTLGANRRQVLWTIVVPAVMPNVVVAMRQMLAVSWTYVVIAEIIAQTTGVGAMMMRARRFLHTDEIMAGIVTIGVLGVLFDFLFRFAHRMLFPYLYERR
jgi:NitT/TauT family transport system permease protein